MTDTTPAAHANAIMAKAAEAEALAAEATPGEWEWSDCFDPEGDNCGIVEVRIPSKRHWDGDGYYYLRIADMEWATGEDMHTAEFIAASRTLVPQLAAALRECVTALEWYADDVHNYNDDRPGVDEANWVPGADQYENLGWIADNGERARAAMAQAAAAMGDDGE